MYYWVNQGKTYKEEKEGGYLWAPIKNNKGSSFFHWENMKKLNPNDIVFNYRKGFIIGYCEVETNCFLAPQPEEFNVDVEWENEGYMANSSYILFTEPISIEHIFDKIARYLPEKYSPLNNSGKDHKIRANQGYLYEIDQNIAEQIFKFAGMTFNNIFDLVNENTNEFKPKVTSRINLTSSRIGQGEYRQKVLRRWRYKCAVNNSNVQEVLIASHIVPWREATDSERLDVENGLLLSPTFDALFDKYFISFSNTGEIMLSSVISKTEFLKMGVTGNEKINNLSPKNKSYLKRHRDKLLKL